MIDTVEFNFFALQADLALSKKLGTEFQDFFVSVASAIWGADFEPRRPQGSIGDRKCDGYRVSTKTVFQSYAPRSIEAKAIEGKIQEDFSGALEHFKQEMKGWTLVHNDWAGLPTTSHELVMSLRSQHAHLTIESWGPDVLKQEIMTLPANKLRVLLPGVPSALELRRIAFKEIEELVRVIETEDPKYDLSTPLAPSPTKLEYNSLSGHITGLLKAGEISATKFRDYFSETSRVETGNRIADKFNRDYKRRREAGHAPDQIFFGLVELAGGLDCDKPTQAAVIGLLAYLFHTCDIFEDMPRASDDSPH